MIVQLESVTTCIGQLIRCPSGHSAVIATLERNQDRPEYNNVIFQAIVRSDENCLTSNVSDQWGRLVIEKALRLCSAQDREKLVSELATLLQTIREGTSNAPI